MPKLKQLVAELDELQRKLGDVEASMSKATSVLELQLFELEETKLVEAYQRKNAELLRKKQRLRKKEFALGQQSGGVASEDPFKYSRSIKLWGGNQSTVVAPRAPANSIIMPEDVSKGIDDLDLDESSEDDSGEAHRKEDEKSAELQRWQIKEEDLKIDYDRCLGKGSFGAVYLGRCRGTTVAVKILDGDVNDEVMEDFKNEVIVMSKLRHANLLLFMGLSTGSGKLKLVTEYASRGSLHDLLREKPGIDFKRKMLVAKQSSLGVFWLHQSKILHLDLKPANIFVDENWVTKVADFGLSQLKDDIQFAGGTLHYMAPEVLNGEDFDEKADVYSFGLVLWEFMSETVPWNNVLVKFEDFKEHVAVRQERPKMPANVPANLAQLIEHCWSQNPAHRPTMQQIVSSDIFDHLIIEHVITDKIGQEFWKAYFFGKYEVKWSRFIRGFMRFLGISLVENYDRMAEFIALRLSLEQPGSSAAASSSSSASSSSGAAAHEGSVTIESFSAALSWHGPLTKGKNFVINVHKMWSSLPGFVGPCSSKEAEQLLAPEKIKESTYMIRFSSTPGDYVVSFKAKKTKETTSNRFVHYKIIHKPGGPYQFDNKDFESLDACIKVMKKHAKLPFPGNKFSQVVSQLSLNVTGASDYKVGL